jgi:hypothetical protein
LQIEKACKTHAKIMQIVFGFKARKRQKISLFFFSFAWICRELHGFAW